VFGLDNKQTWLYLLLTIGNLLLISMIIVALPDIVEAVLLGIAAVFNMTSAILLGDMRRKSKKG
jgi:hypothetical protein